MRRQRMSALVSEREKEERGKAVKETDVGPNSYWGSGVISPDESPPLKLNRTVKNLEGQMPMCA
jgi:hypothetical protein